jgi:hypothetical protein
MNHGSMEDLPDQRLVTIELGDEFIILSTKYVKTQGTVYYRDDNLVRIRPVGAPDRLYDFPLIDNKFDPELGISKYLLVKKAIFAGFVEQHDLRKGQSVSTFTADGEPAGNFTITAVDPDSDSATFTDETDAELEIEFNGEGIPLGYPFAIIFTSDEKPPAAAKEEAPADALEAQAEAEAAAGTVLPSEAAAVPVPETDADGNLVEGSAMAADDDEFDLEFVGTVAVPIVEQVQVLARSQRVYPDLVQKADALQDFTTLLKAEDQQNIAKLRKIRALTEMSFALKQELVEYNPDGTPKKTPRPTSASYLHDLVKMAPIPLGRPVLDVDKRLYEMSMPDGSEGFMIQDEQGRKVVLQGAGSGVRDAVEEAYLAARAANMNEEEVELAVATAAAKVQGQGPPVEEADQLDDAVHIVDMREELEQIRGFMAPGAYAIQFWIQIQGYMSRFHQPWTAAPAEGDAAENTWTALADGEFFRARIPDPNSRNIKGIRPDAIHDPETLYIGKVYSSYARALGSTYRSGKDKQRHILFSPDVAPLKSYMIFPFNYAYALGTSRSGYLLQDIINSHAATTYMAKILRLTKGVQDEATSNGILAIGNDGNTLGNIKVADYISGLPFSFMGTADAARELRHLGLGTLEWNDEQGKVIAGLIADHGNAVRSYVAELRKTLEQMPATVAKPNMLWPKDDMAWLFNDALTSEPLLASAISEFTKQSPAAAASDYALISYLVAKHYDYFLAAAGQNAVQVARERLKTTRSNFLAALRTAVKIRDAEKGLAPQPNKCEHVMRLRDIRRLPDQADRFKHLMKFLVRFQGQRNANYIQCSICSRDLLCVHELLELKAFMNSREKEPLRKELLLHFCGPVMGNTYQCRNCGQALGEIDYDNNMEFDDAGRPMVGYAVLDDMEEVKIDEIDKALGAQESTIPTETDFGNESKNFTYRVLRDIADRIGVYPTKTDYDAMIGQVQSVISEVGDRDSFIAQQAQMAAQLGKKVRLPDYELVLNRTMVAAAGAYMLIHVQAKIPDYMPASNLPGCKNPGFRGFPLEEEENMQGQEYVSCAISTIMRNTAPWNMTGFQKEISDEKRLRNVLKVVNASIRDAMDKPDVQLLLAAKRKYRREIYGDTGDVQDMISPFFLPPQRIITPADAAAAGTVVNAGVTADTTANRRADVWIQVGNQIAAKVAIERGEIIAGSPFAEGTCCYGPIGLPADFWSKVDLPALPKRALRPGAIASRALVRFSPRSQAEMLAAPPENLYYILFLNVCFQGSRYGLPHEPGLTHKCPHCEFQFPGSMQLMDAEKEGKAALEAQSVAITRDTFIALLDATHQRYAVQPYDRPTIMGPYEHLRSIGMINPAPMDGWPALIESLITELQSLPPDATAAMVQSKLGPLSQVGEQALGDLSARLTKTANENLQLIAAESPASLAELSISYFVVPFKRLITQLDPVSLETIRFEVAKDMSTKHLKSLKTEVFQKNITVQRLYAAPVKKATFVQAKLSYCVDQLAQVAPLIKRLSATNIPGGERTLRYLVRAIVFAPLAMLMNPNALPPNAPYQEAGASLVENSLRLTYDILAETLRRFRAEQLVYSEERLRDELQIRAEQEKINIIRNFDRMSDDERRVELMKKQLRMGQWAVGGSSKIIRYNADFYDIESEQRREAGIQDFVAGPFDPDMEAAPAGRPHDANGLYNFGEDGSEAANAYDMAPMAEEDY